MIITPYSVFYSIIWGSISLIFLRVSYLFLLRHNCFRLVLYCAVFVILRYLFVLDLPFDMVPEPIYNLSEKITYYSNKFLEFIPDMLLYLLPASGWIMIGKGLLLIWFAVAAILIIKDLRDMRYIANKSKEIPLGEGYKRAHQVLGELQREHGKKYDIKIICSPYVQVPFTRGWIHPIIYMGSASLSDCELYDVLKHEYTHIVFHDNWLKIILYYTKFILWWNPLVKLLTDVLEDACEYRCDSVVTKDMDDMAKLNYASLINKFAAKAMFNLKLHEVDSAYVSKKEKDYIFQRISAFLKPQPLRLREKVIYVGVLIIITLGSVFFSVPTIEQSGNLRMSNDYLNISEGNGYLVKKENGRYALYIYGTLIDDDIVDITGLDFPIKEEKKWD